MLLIIQSLVIGYSEQPFKSIEFISFKVTHFACIPIRQTRTHHHSYTCVQNILNVIGILYYETLLVLRTKISR